MAEKKSGSSEKKPTMRKMTKNEQLIIERHSRPRHPKAHGSLMDINRDEGKDKPGDNSKLLTHFLEMLTWGTLNNPKDIDELTERFMKTINYIRENDLRVTNQLVYMGLGLDKERVNYWANGVNATQEQSIFAKKVKQFCAMCREQYMESGRLDKVVGIWWQKNYDGFRDVTETVITNTLTGIETKTVSELKSKYQDDLLE